MSVVCNLIRVEICSAFNYFNYLEQERCSDVLVVLMAST